MRWKSTRCKIIGVRTGSRCVRARIHARKRISQIFRRNKPNELCVCTEHNNGEMCNGIMCAVHCSRTRCRCFERMNVGMHLSMRESNNKSCTRAIAYKIAAAAAAHTHANRVNNIYLRVYAAVCSAMQCDACKVEIKNYVSYRVYGTIE